MGDATVTAGRGVLHIAMAKAYFMAAGYAIYFTLPRFLGTAALWGDYLLVIGLVSVIDNVIVTGTIQGVSRFTAQDDVLADGVKRAALKLQLLLGGGVAAAFALAAPWVAAWEKDTSLTDLYRLSSGIIFCYAFYAVFVGSLNGLRRFGRQATLDVGFATMRAALILGGAAAGLGVGGAVGGFVAAAAVIVVVSGLWVKLPARGAAVFDWRRLFRFMMQMFAYHLALNLVMRADLFLLKRFMVDIAVGVDNAVKMASTFAGYYGTAQSLAFIPYQAILAVAFVIFPLVSRSTFEQDLATTQAYIRQTLRLSLVFVAGVAVVLIANPAAVINVPYPEIYRQGAPALRILSAGMVCFSMFTIINTILNGAGRTGLAMLSGAVTLVLTVGANVILVPRAGSELEALTRAALATSGSMAAGVVLCTVLLHRQFKASFPPATLVRTAIAMAVAVVVGHFVPEVSKLVTLGECMLVFGVYLLTLVLLREFGPEDRARFARVLGKKR